MYKIKVEERKFINESEKTFTYPCHELVVDDPNAKPQPKKQKILINCLKNLLKPSESKEDLTVVL